ncbi:hypothetical protein BCR43DRAFT_490545 [Syncephalastrum racemosum]|uniref:Uncharacterized protein n=1 Tax=Syncephalastrum racemosum TaxID=13706 RepID=A0A1X2HG92_SYNRA|nr:hypothetical protein BCR43DRAFT_490545 [Syncephalastrum racemosum]
MDFYLFQPHRKTRVSHTGHQALRKCCGCIHLRVGSAIACIVWAALSFYFAITSFQSKSPFYSHLDTAAILVFGVCNLIHAVISLGCLGALYLDRWEFIRSASHSVFVGVFLVLVDGLINAILFITRRSEYTQWCIDSTSNQLGNSINNTSLASSQDFYNCNRTWQDELKFGLMAILMMIAFYVYWALCFYSYYIKKYCILLRMGVFDPMMPPPPMPPGMMPPVPPPGVPPGMGGMMPPPPPGPPMPGGRRNIIVLNNEKPSNKKTKQKHLDELPHWIQPPPYYSSTPARPAASVTAPAAAVAEAGSEKNHA